MDRQVSSNFTEIDLQTVAPILAGNLDSLPPISSRLVRVFISSTFSDMVEERNVLMEKLYPQLKDFCREKYGLEFQIMDLRWGIRDEAQNDHTTIDFCIREIENCKTSSIGPSFVALLGQKYGYRPFPPNIAADEFVLVKSALEELGADVSLLETWFRRDDNILPAIYCLQPISSILTNYNDEDEELREIDRDKWTAIFEEIKSLLREGVTYCVENKLLPAQNKDKYFVSVTEYEIEKGMKDVPDCSKHCVCLFRTITDLDEHLEHPETVHYTDLISRNAEFDQEAQELLQELRVEKIPKLCGQSDNLDSDNLCWLYLQWGDKDRPTCDSLYLEEFCKVMYEKLTNLITSAMMEIQNLVSDTFVVEVIQHLSLCKVRCNIFRGREETMEKISRYVTSDPSQPLVIYGESGCGKTSVLAKAASLVWSWLPDNISPILILRFLGTSARSTSIRLVLGSVCWQIAMMYRLDITDIPSDYPSLVTYFHEILKVATPDRPLLICFDSLDQLSTTHRAHNLIWLPQRLPPNVRFIVSTLPNEHNLLSTLHSIVTDPNYVEILPLGQSISINIMKEWLQMADRDLTEEQFNIVKDALSECSLPLYTRLVFQEVCRWRSYDTLNRTVLETTVKGVINKLFDNVERHHGRTFVMHSLSFITASRNGLSDAELEDVLSLDDVVLNDVFIHWIPPIRRIPPLLWPRLYDDLSNYMVQREANGIVVYWWFHRQFISVAKKRYLKEEIHRNYIHWLLADYFLGTWGAGKKKPFTYTQRHMDDLDLDSLEGEADRKVPDQPLQFGKSIPFAHKGKVLYNLRKLHELPYHLIMSQRISDLRYEILFNYTWLHTKLSATSLQDVLSDFVMLEEESSQDQEIQLLQNTLRVGGSYVNQNPDTLAFDLLGRLLPFYDKFDNIRSLLQQCDRLSRRHSALLPVFQSYESPSEILLYILEDHTKLVLWLAFSKSSNELVSVSKDGTVAFWDIARGERMRIFDIASIRPSMSTKILRSENERYLVFDSETVDSPAQIFDIKQGQMLHECGQRIPTQRRVFVVNTLLCRQKDIIDMSTGEKVRSLDTFTTTRQYVTVAISHNERFILIGGQNMTSMYDLDTTEYLTSFPGENVPSKIVFSQDDKQAYVGYSVDCLFKVFDIDPWSDNFGKIILDYNFETALPFVKFLEGPQYGRELAEISLCKTDENVCLLNIRRSNLLILNMASTESYINDMDAINGTDETFLYGSTFSYDGKYVIAADANMLHIWRASHGTHLSSIMVHSVDRFPFSVSHQSNLVATGSNIHTAIKIWDIDKIHGQEDNQLRIYENPIDMVALASSSRLLFVKQYYPLSSGQGYKYLQYFAIDVWNLSTGTSQNFLPFAHYGQLLQMDTSPSGHQMVLLLSSRNDTYVCVINVKKGKIDAMFSHPGCESFTISHDRDLIATVAKAQDASSDVKIWSLSDGIELILEREASNPLFTFDNNTLLCLSDSMSIVSYNINEFFGRDEFFVGKIDKIQLIPGQASAVLFTVFPEGEEIFASVRIYNIIDEAIMFELSNVGPSGILDISKDGKYGIDGFLQVFDLFTGETVIKLAGEIITDDEEKKPKLHSIVYLTWDGRYAVWVDSLILQVCRVRDGRIIANTSTHEIPTCLHTMDYGYFIVIGREDGHIVPLKLFDPEITAEEDFDAFSAEERLSSVLNQCPLLDEDVSDFEKIFKEKSYTVPDTDLPKAKRHVQKCLTEKSLVPHAIIHASRRRSSTLEVAPDDSPLPSPIMSPRRGRAWSDVDFARTHRGSLQELLSPTKFIKSTSGLFLSFSGSSDNMSKDEDDC